MTSAAEKQCRDHVKELPFFFRTLFWKKESEMCEGQTPEKYIEKLKSQGLSDGQAWADLKSKLNKNFPLGKRK